jgi:RNA polymerase sigma-70 factor (ECF subfamily)
MPLTESLRNDILAAVPSLRAFAISLSGNADRADDLVQETLLRALANIDSFQPGSNLPAWLFTILRNLFRSDYRKRRREVEDAEGNYAKTLKTQPSQNAHLEFEEFRVALDKLPQDQREALILVGASGFSYEDAAAICGCAVGTIKSRVNRARSKLSALLYVDGADRAAANGGGVLVGEAGGANQDQRFALVLRQLVEGVTEFLEFQMRILRRLGLQGFRVVALGVLHFAPPLPVIRAKQVAQDGEQPRRQVGARLERVDVGNGPQQRFLNKVVGTITIT